MRFNTIAVRLFGALALTPVVFCLVACSDSESSVPAVVYSGSTTPIDITVENGAAGAPMPRVLVHALAQWTKDAHRRPAVDMAAGVTVSTQGDWGGSISDTYSETPTSVSGSYPHSSFCDSTETDGAELNGTLSYSGRLSETNSTTHIAMTFTTTSMKSATQNMIMSGTLDMVMDVAIDPVTGGLTQFTTSATMNLAI